MIFFALPMYGGFCMSPFFKSCMELKEAIIDIPHEFSLLTNESAVHRARNQLAKTFMESNHERLMFIDSDIEFESDAIGRLWAMDADIAVGLYPMKKIGAPKAAWVDGKLIKKLPKAPFEVDYAGTGFMMIKRHVFEKMKPFLKVEQTEQGERVRYFHFDNVMDGVEISEDYEFCRLAKELGFKVVADPAIKLKHYGLHGY